MAGERDFLVALYSWTAALSPHTSDSSVLVPALDACFITASRRAIAYPPNYVEHLKATGTEAYGLSGRVTPLTLKGVWLQFVGVRFGLDKSRLPEPWFKRDRDVLLAGDINSLHDIASTDIYDVKYVQAVVRGRLNPSAIVSQMKFLQKGGKK